MHNSLEAAGRCVYQKQGVSEREVASGDPPQERMKISILMVEVDPKQQALSASSQTDHCGEWRTSGRPPLGRRPSWCYLMWLSVLRTAFHFWSRVLDCNASPLLFSLVGALTPSSSQCYCIWI